MAIERTLSIIKPGAVRDNHIGGIVAKFEAAGLRVVAQKMIRMSAAQAGDFYGVHRDKPFFGELVEFMTYGPVVVQVLEAENAIQLNRDWSSDVCSSDLLSALSRSYGDNSSMAVERTLSIIKPGAVRDNHIGGIDRKSVV